MGKMHRVQCGSADCQRRLNADYMREYLRRRKREDGVRYEDRYAKAVECSECGEEFQTRHLAAERCQPCARKVSIAAVHRRQAERLFWDRLASAWEAHLRALPVLFVGPRPFVSPPVELPERHPARQDWSKSTGLTFVYGWCRICGEPFMAATGAGVARFCSDRCLARAHKRKSGVSGQVRVEVYERDGWRCQICNLMIPKRYRDHPTHRLAPTIDHIVPRSRGGSDDEWNLQTAHRSCNSSKCDGAANDQMRLAV